MNLLRGIAEWARLTACEIWQLVAPHASRKVAGGIAADVARSRRDLVLENAMLRHQLLILRRKFPHPKLTTLDRLCLLVAAAVLPTWRRVLTIVQPETLIRWHRQGFRMFWRRRSRPGNS
jgi:putative transposase